MDSRERLERIKARVRVSPLSYVPRVIVQGGDIKDAEKFRKKYRKEHPEQKRVVFIFSKDMSGGVKKTW